MAVPTSVDTPSSPQPGAEAHHPTGRKRRKRKRRKRSMVVIGAIASVVGFLASVTGTINDGLGIFSVLAPSPATTPPSTPDARQPTPWTSPPPSDIPSAPGAAAPNASSGPSHAAAPAAPPTLSAGRAAATKPVTSSAPPPTADAAVPPTEPIALALVDQPFGATSSSAHSTTCATGGRTYRQSVMLSVPSSDPARGGFARADVAVPSGMHRLVATVGLVDGSPSSSTVGVHVFIESPPGTFTNYTLPSTGDSIAVDVPVTAGARLRIQASASAARQVCLGAPHLKP